MKEKYNKYLELLNKWQPKINLISNSTLKDAYERHILDSLELSKYINNKNAKIFDLGSGGGFPGAILAIEGFKNVSLIESDTRKTTFLQQIKLAYDLKSLSIKNDRVENISEKADIIVCRAFAPLIKVFDFSNNIISDSTEFILLKSENYKEEIKEAQKKYIFNCEIKESNISKKTYILLI